MPAVGLVVDDRGRMKQSVLGYPWEAASRCSSLIEASPAQFSFSFAPNMQVLMAENIPKEIQLPLASKVGLCFCFGISTCRACCDTLYILRGCLGNR